MAYCRIILLKQHMPVGQNSGKFMFKKIIILSAIFIIIGISSCSMWDDVDKNAAFIIPVANINVNNAGAPNPSQWYGIPIFAQNDKSKNPVSQQSINQIQVATNLEKTKLYINIELNAVVSGSYYVIVLSNDFNCDGYYIKMSIQSGGVLVQYKCDPCGGSFNSAVPMTYYLISGYNNARFEVSINIPAELPNLNNSFLLSIFSTNNIATYPSIPAAIVGSTTHARWAKLK